MRLMLNGDDCEIAASTLDQLMIEQGYKGAKIATAVNGEFVHQQSRAEFRLSEGDRVEVVAPIAGG